ncbi:MAG: hypothetical protein AAFX87_24115 [Bacteroidota bacterium]
MNLRLVTLLLSIVILSSFYKAKNKHIGTWEATEKKGKKIVMTFGKKGYMMVEMEGEKFGGESFEKEGKLHSMTYKTDYSFSPAHIDIILTELESGTTEAALGIFDFPEKHKMRMVADAKGKGRPDSFDNDDTLVFTRVGAK